MPSLCISGVRTMNQRGQNATLFHPYFDALALTMDIAASADSLPCELESVGQLTDHPLSHGEVVIERTWRGTFQWGGGSGSAWATTGERSTTTRRSQRRGLSWAGSGHKASSASGESSGPTRRQVAPTTPSMSRESAASGHRRSQYDRARGQREVCASCGPVSASSSKGRAGGCTSLPTLIVKSS
jgi:hypothetical protein